MPRDLEPVILIPALPMPSSFLERLGDGEARPEKAPTWPTDKPVPTTATIAAAYAVCKIMFGLKTCSCEKIANTPCPPMARAVEAVIAKTRWWA